MRFSKARQRRQASARQWDFAPSTAESIDPYALDVEPLEGPLFLHMATADEEPELDPAPLNLADGVNIVPTRTGCGLGGGIVFAFPEFVVVF